MSVSDDPEEEFSFEVLEEKAKSGDAKAQTKVSVEMNILQNTVSGHMVTNTADQPSFAKCY